MSLPKWRLVYKRFLLTFHSSNRFSGSSSSSSSSCCRASSAANRDWCSRRRYGSALALNSPRPWSSSRSLSSSSPRPYASSCSTCPAASTPSCRSSSFRSIQSLYTSTASDKPVIRVDHETEHTRQAKCPIFCGRSSRTSMDFSCEQCGQLNCLSRVTLALDTTFFEDLRLPMGGFGNHDARATRKWVRVGNGWVGGWMKRGKRREMKHAQP